jgi:hypothetical protein
MTAVTTTGEVQTQFDAAVVIPTVLRPSLGRAVRSVFDQDLKGRIQILIGIDQRQGADACLEGLARECPDHICLTILDLGYSTSSRHGGFYSCHYGGSLRTILSYAANSRYVAYLDDDDWWARGHLSALQSAIAGKSWAFSYRWLVDRATGWPICRDGWDSVGPGRGINQQRYGGFVCPSTLFLDKSVCHFVLPYWSVAPGDDGAGEDRLVFEALLQHKPWGSSGKYSCYYEVSGEVLAHHHHAREFAARRIGWIYDRAQVDTVTRLADEAERALDSGDTGSAIATSQRALAINPYHAPSLYTLARAEHQAGSARDASSHLLEALAVDDRDPAILAAWSQITGRPRIAAE